MRHFNDFDSAPVALTSHCDRCGVEVTILVLRRATPVECPDCIALARAVWPNAMPINSTMASGA